MDDIADYLSTTGTAFKFNDIGDAVGGTIINAKIVEGEDLSRPPKPTKTLVITLESKDGDEWSVWVKPGQMLTALSNAVKTAKPGVTKPSIEEGDKVSFTFERTEPSKTVGFNPKKVYAVAYKAAAPSAVSADDLI